MASCRPLDAESLQGSSPFPEWEDEPLTTFCSTFIIITALFGNGQSSSPSNSLHLKPFLRVTFYDNVRAQHKLVTEHLAIKHLRAVIGWSMVGGQSFQLATQYPDMMDLCIPFCGSARTSLHNAVFLEGQKSYLLGAHGQTSAGVGLGAVGDNQIRAWSEPQRNAAINGFGRGYAGWGFSQTFYRERKTVCKALRWEDS